MKYVYLLDGIKFQNEIYVGLTDNRRQRLAARNAGQSTYTKRIKPWRLAIYFAFFKQGQRFRALSQIRDRSRICQKTDHTSPGFNLCPRAGKSRHAIA
ncbi:MAG TPA: GIY-YIG nuclease family protein [Pseudolabrys sp.]|jgi:predicted GIY-YIG superfamily endonuclease|nr:GIY-YIG nuclease family protein [Pseudolabrys sp.]